MVKCIRKSYIIQVIIIPYNNKLTMQSTNNRFTTPVRTRVVENTAPDRERVPNTVTNSQTNSQREAIAIRWLSEGYADVNSQRRAIAIRWLSEGDTDVSSDNEGSMMDTRE